MNIFYILCPSKRLKKCPYLQYVSSFVFFSLLFLSKLLRETDKHSWSTVYQAFSNSMVSWPRLVFVQSFESLKNILVLLPCPHGYISPFHWKLSVSLWLWPMKCEKVCITSGQKLQVSRSLSPASLIVDTW